MKTAAGIIGEIDQYFGRLKKLTNHVTNYWPAFESFAKFIFGYYNGTVWMRILDQVKFSGTGQLLFCQLIAASCLIVSKEVYDDVCNGTLGSKENLKNKGNAYGSWFGGQFIRDKSKSWGKVIPKGAVLSNGYKIPFDVRVDKNNMASEAIKRAMIETFKRKGIPVAGKGSFSDYTACHVWDATYHPWYHTSVDNLVLVPNMIYGLTDHCPKVQEMLRYEMYKRFGRMGVSNPSLPTWLTPKKPSFYNNIIWRCEA